MNSKTKTKTVKVGDKIYVDSSYYISHGSDDFVGGIATVSKIKIQMSGGVNCTFVGVTENPHSLYNWDQELVLKQSELKKEYGNQVAHPDPDIDTPWIENGDIVNGKVYHGKDIR